MPNRNHINNFDKRKIEQAIKALSITTTEEASYIVLVAGAITITVPTDRELLDDLQRVLINRLAREDREQEAKKNA